jgi:RNase adaptor protein for sRNA GlmZ degradation
VIDSWTNSRVQTIITSFGYGHSAPPEATIVLDLRVLFRNPHRDPRLRELTGLHPDVREHVMATARIEDLVASTVTQVCAVLASAGNPQFVRVDVAVGCAGGRHRSVALAEELATRLEMAGVGVEVVHRDIDKPLLNPS